MFEYKVIETVNDFMENTMNVMAGNGYRVISVVHTSIDKRNVFITFERPLQVRKDRDEWLS